MDKYKSNKIIIIILILVVISLGAIYYYVMHQQKGIVINFNGTRAFENASYQVSLGPRIPGSEAHADVIDWLMKQLNNFNWNVELQTATYDDHEVQNVIAKRGNGSPWIILGAHYDSRLWADQDPDLALRKMSVPGANDGASGVAILVELARTIPKSLNEKIWLVFFDAEDNGGIPGWDWLLGSKEFVLSLDKHPDMVVVVDMTGDSNLDIYKEQNSNIDITNLIWSQAARLGYSSEFINNYKHSILDDHTPFLEAGIPAIDIIDFDYPYWHTTQDTIDKISKNSLQIVGDTLWNWIVNSSK
jgi:glutaminyl-peptide cyclotransferase